MKSGVRFIESQSTRLLKQLNINNSVSVKQFLQSITMQQEEADNYIFSTVLDEEERKYVLDLTAFGLGRLEKEPNYLSLEKKRLNKEMEDVTVENLSIFLKTSTTVSESQKLVHSMQSNVDEIISTIPSLLTKTKEFGFKTLKLRNNRKSNRSIVANQMRILEILELPQLMWKCARAKLYPQALDLVLLNNFFFFLYLSSIFIFLFFIFFFFLL